MNAPTRCSATVIATSLPVCETTAPDSRQAATGAPVVIVGGGPVGIRLAQELTRRAIDCVVFNAERWQPYNRVKLTPLLSGDAQIGQVMQPPPLAGPGAVQLFNGQRVIEIDRSARRVTTSLGRVTSYERLVLCTGSRAHVPPIPGAELAGVFTFRDFDDVEKLLARSVRSRRTAVIGGGLLGLEAARGMASRGVAVTVVEHESHVMARQLDDRAADLLTRDLARMDIAIRAGVRVASLAGDTRVEMLELAGGERIVCDTVILCTGIRPNIELAREAGLAVGRGIKVASDLTTTDPCIYAAGECAEIDGHLTGLVGPGFEQAQIVAARIAGEDRRYTRTSPATKLKVIGTEVLSMGDVEQLATRTDLGTRTYEDAGGTVYRRVVLLRGRLVGAIAIGDWPEVDRIQDAIRRRAFVWPWQLLRFARSGRLYAEQAPRSVRQWPRAATVCNCTGVTRGQISEAIALGACTLEDVKRDTGASSVCGSCKVHVAALLEAEPPREPIAGWRLVAGLSLAALVLALINIAAPRWPLMDRIDERGPADLLWLDGFTKQLSGYVLLALSVAAAALSLRKRIRLMAVGEFARWRIVHISIGALAMLALFAHTGFRLGHNLNAWLMSTFLSLAVAGAAAAIASALEHRIASSASTAARLRSLAGLAHVIALWPLPLLLAAHILTVYFY